MPAIREYWQTLKKINRRPQFESLFLFVTSRCNSVCQTCFYWDNLNKNQDLSFEQIQELSRTAPPFRKLWLSGGEPFLRPELADIITLFARNNGVVNVNLPTNGLLAGKIDQVVGRVLQDNPNLSMDLKHGSEFFPRRPGQYPRHPPRRPAQLPAHSGDNGLAGA